jgi:hypothetical protein
MGLQGRELREAPSGIRREKSWPTACYWLRLTSALGVLDVLPESVRRQVAISIVCEQLRRFRHEGLFSQNFR